MGKLVVGDPADPDTDLGPLISFAHRAKVAGIVATELLAPGLPFAAAGFADLEPRYLMGSYAED